MLIAEKYILGRNRDGYYYVIDLKIGAKVEFNLFSSTNIFPWRDSISNSDVIRAKEYDNRDISFLLKQEEKVTEKQFYEFKEKIIKVVDSPEFPFEKVKELPRNSS